MAELAKWVKLRSWGSKRRDQLAHHGGSAGNSLGGPETGRDFRFCGQVRSSSSTDKKLHWIEGTDQRFQGYNYFGKHSEPMLEWFDTYMK